MTTFNRFIGAGTVIIQGNGSGVTAKMAMIRDQFFASASVAGSVALNFPVPTGAANNMVLTATISVITTDGTTGFAVSTTPSVASANYNGVVVAATGTLPTVVFTSSGVTAGLAAIWSVSGSNLVLTLTAPTLNAADFMVTTEQFSVY